MNERTPKSAVTIGTFDGVHRGHQKLLGRTAELAEGKGVKSKVFTFTAPPRKLMNGVKRSLLLPFSKKIELLNRVVDQVIVADFEKIKELNPGQFVENALIDKMNASHVVVGHDWRFGHNESGSADLLKRLGRGRFKTHIMEPVEEFSKPISSTRIRQNLREGNINRSRKLLGRSPALYGEVVEGRKVGAELGFPTANVSVSRKILIPKNGIYASIVKAREEFYRGALYIGDRPTFEEEEPAIEVHLLTEKDLDLYGAEMEIHLIEYVREQEKFSDRELLAEQIKKDKKEIRKILDERKQSHELSAETEVI